MRILCLGALLWSAATAPIALAAPITLNWAHTNPNLVTDPNSISQTVGGVTVTARGYTVEFSGSVATVFGPFPTTPGQGSLQMFGTITSGLTTQPGLGLLSQPAAGIAVSGSDIGGGNAVRGIDSWPYQSDKWGIYFTQVAPSKPL